jgi:hypothetical protein
VEEFVEIAENKLVINFLLVSYCYCSNRRLFCRR